MPSTSARAVPAALTPFVMIGRELRDLGGARLPFVGGCVGTALLGGSLLALLLLGDPAEASATNEDADQFQLEFEPGALTQLGAEPEPIPQKPIHDATHAADPQTPDTVTDQPIVTEPEPDSPDPVPEPEPETRPDTNPYNEANNDAPDIGNPFGDPEGWAETLADGDPWATGVMKALNGMSVPAYAGQLPAGKSFQFKLKICKTGKIDSVLVKQSSGSVELDGAIKFELLRLSIPKPPPHVLAQMDSACVLIKYTFAWQQGRVQ